MFLFVLIFRKEDFNLAISREKKELLVKEYLENLNNSQGIVITSNNGLKVSELEELRNKIRDAEGRFYIVKNTLLKLALKEADFPEIDDLLVGPVGVGFCHENIPGVAKAITDFAKDNEQLVVKGGLLGTQLVDEKGVKSLASLPSLNELRGQLVGLINAPATQLVGVLAGSVRQVVNVVNAYAEKDEQEAEETA